MPASCVFLTFVLAPFVEGFLVSLKPLSQLFSSPYRFIPENGSFEAYRTMWVSVPGFGALYLQFASSSPPSSPPSC